MAGNGAACLRFDARLTAGAASPQNSPTPRRRSSRARNNQPSAPATDRDFELSAIAVRSAISAENCAESSSSASCAAACKGATTVSALIVSSLGFDLIHLIPTRRLWPFVLWATVEGVTLCTMYLLTRSLLLTIVVHVLNDGVGYAMFAVERKRHLILVPRCRVEFPVKETIVPSNKRNEVVEW